MDVKFLNPFLEAAYMVLQTELGVDAQRGELQLERSAATTDDIAVLISLVGEAAGIVMYSLSEGTALAIVSKILDQPFHEFDELAQSGIGELGNVITGQAGQRLAAAGLDVNISPPTLVLGKGTLVSTLDFDRLVVPLHTEMGALNIHLALRETPPS